MRPPSSLLPPRHPTSAADDFRLGNKALATDHIGRYLLQACVFELAGLQGACSCVCSETQKTLHAQKKTFGTDTAMFMSLATDNMKTTLPLFPDLLKRYKVLLYQGHYDLRDGVVCVRPLLISLSSDSKAVPIAGGV